MSNEIKDLSDEILKNFDYNKTLFVKFSSEHKSLVKSINSSSIVLASNPKILKNFLNRISVQKKSINDLSILIYCQYFDVSIFHDNAISPKTLVHLKFIYFLQQMNEDIIKLYTFNEFSSIECQNVQLESVGIFIINQSKWLILERLDKYYNFNQCPIVVASPQHNKYFFAYSLVEENFIGLIPDIVTIVAEKYNFTVFYEMIDFITKKGVYLKYKFIEIPGKVLKHPDIIIRDSSLFGHEIEYYHAISLGIEARMIFAISPGELYTSYEKLLLPFDLTTWIFLILTFITAFSFISMFNLASRNVKDLIYGKSIKHPALNVVSIFFGIALKKIAKENASRILLILFIWFCLIFRTCYQSKIFEFMTNEMRKPSPQTINELFEQNFTIITQEWNYAILKGFEPWQRSKITILEHSDFSDLRYSLRIYNSTTKIALLTMEENILKHSLYFSLFYQRNMNVEILKEEFCTFGVIFSVDFMDILLNPMQKVIKQLIPAGIPQHSFAYHKFMMNDRKRLKFEKKPQVLTVQNLSFGFIIWLIVLSSSFIAFIGEIIVHKLTKKPVKEEKKIVKVKFAKIHPMVEKKNVKNETEKFEEMDENIQVILSDLEDNSNLKILNETC
ncbi:hypothetical protein PVAND_002377 [Polypedilum vanderplanki]|uniref:Ionotropic receptor n=1 Tax=Polypedilum vanderplanki TaxID=319348 RepID=A0A9J6BRZ7_POLVA|nr:hypothetical protein PVAND_002377 [Polypedilum vanderplanki]